MPTSSDSPKPSPKAIRAAAKKAVEELIGRSRPSGAGVRRPIGGTLIRYRDHNFGLRARQIIHAANKIIEGYRRQGYTLTLRQLYYQFVQRNYLPNTMKSYDLLGRVINDARMAGLVDWKAIEDRTRNVREYECFKNPHEAALRAAQTYQRNKWSRQPYRPEVWIEKDALLGVIEPICQRLQVPYFSCRGYTSQSEQWRAGRRFAKRLERGQQPIVFHLGDHDPSGIDMTRDNEERLNAFVRHHVPGGRVIMKRLALNMEQVALYNPPPNPAKLSDSRADAYVAEHGRSSWELDALAPPVLSSLVEVAVLGIRDQPKWDRMLAEETAQREVLMAFANSLKPKKDT